MCTWAWVQLREWHVDCEPLPILFNFFLAALCLNCSARIFSRCGEWGLLPSCGARASHCGGLSCCRARGRASVAAARVLVALQHVGSSWTRDHRTHLPCIGRWILSHWMTREVPCSYSWGAQTLTSTELSLWWVFTPTALMLGCVSTGQGQRRPREAPFQGTHGGLFSYIYTVGLFFVTGKTRKTQTHYISKHNLCIYKTMNLHTHTHKWVCIHFKKQWSYFEHLGFPGSVKHSQKGPPSPSGHRKIRKSGAHLAATA